MRFATGVFIRDCLLSGPRSLFQRQAADLNRLKKKCGSCRAAYRVDAPLENLNWGLCHCPQQKRLLSAGINRHWNGNEFSLSCRFLCRLRIVSSQRSFPPAVRSGEVVTIHSLPRSPGKTLWQMPPNLLWGALAPDIPHRLTHTEEQAVCQSPDSYNSVSSPCTQLHKTDPKPSPASENKVASVQKKVMRRLRCGRRTASGWGVRQGTLSKVTVARPGPSADARPVGLSSHPRRVYA